MQVIKRDGRKVKFDINKISEAVRKAYMEVYPNVNVYTDSIISDISGRIDDLGFSEITIEQIQDIVEKELMNDNKDVAKAYITYRYRRAMARDEYKALMADVKEKLSAENVQNQNANVDEHSFGGRIGETADLIMKRYALDYCMSDMAKNNHLNNEIYIHDLSHYAVGDHNCLSVPFDDLLAKGFNTRQTDVRPAQSVSTAFQLVAVLFQLQSLQQFGGVSATHIDWTMVPYVRKSFTKHLSDGLAWCENCSSYKVRRFSKWIKNNPDYPDNTIHFDDEDFKTKYPVAWEYAIEMTTKEVYQAVEGMYHNLKIWA